MIRFVIAILTVMFTGCKLAGVAPVVDWSWWLVLSPVLGYLGYVTFVLFLVFAGFIAVAVVSS